MTDLLYGNETFSNLTQPKIWCSLSVVPGSEILNSESDINLVFGLVTQNLNELPSANVLHVNIAFN